MTSGLLRRSSGKAAAAKAFAGADSSKSTATLLQEFFRFYHASFDWKKESVSIRAGRRGPPTSDLPSHMLVSATSPGSQVGPAIEDPFTPAQNLGDCLTAETFAHLRGEFKRATALVDRSAGASLSELIEPWTPP